jgi:hypothetical protein
MTNMICRRTGVLMTMDTPGTTCTLTEEKKAMSRKTLTLGISILLVAVTIACGGSPTAPSPADSVAVPASPPAPAPSPAPTPAPAPVPSPSPTPTPVPSPDPSPTPAPTPGQTPFTQTISETADRFENAFHQLTVPRSGMLAVKLRWSDGRDDLDLTVSEGTCRVDEVGCPAIAESIVSAGTLEQLSVAVTQGQVLRIWALNGSPRPVAYTIEIDIR